MLRQKFAMQWDPAHQIELPERVKVPRLMQVARDLFDGTRTWWIDEVYLRMAENRQHTFLVSTRHPDNLRSYIQNGRNLHEEQLMGGVYQPLPNVWLGVCCNSRDSLLAGAKILGEVDAHVRWLHINEWDTDYLMMVDALEAVARMSWVVLNDAVLPTNVHGALCLACSTLGVPYLLESGLRIQWPAAYTPPEYQPDPDDTEVGDGLEDI